MATMDIIVVGGINSDLLVRGPALPRPGETASATEFAFGSGGKGGNQAVAAARLGARVALIGRVGADVRGDALVEALSAEGVDTTHVSRDDTHPSGLAAIHVDRSGAKQIMAYLGANRALRVDDVRRAREVIASCSVLLAQLEVPLEPVHEALRLAREAGALTVLDPAPVEPLDDDVLRLVDVLRLNAREAEALAHMTVVDQASARRAAQRLLERGAGGVVVQVGELGDLVVGPDGELFLRRFDVETVDSTGAGDAFSAALAVAFGERILLPPAARFGSAAAALTTTRLGAQAALPTRAEVQKLLSRD